MVIRQLGIHAGDLNREAAAAAAETGRNVHEREMEVHTIQWD
jgi:hypothetical protein